LKEVNAMPSEKHGTTDRNPAPSAEPGPSVAAADKPPGQAAGEPLKGEVSRTDSPGAGISAAPAARAAAAPAPLPANPAAAQTAATSEWSSAIDEPSAPADEATRPRAPRSTDPEH
jgi:hypothetical protein